MGKKLSLGRVHRDGGQNVLRALQVPPPRRGWSCQPLTAPSASEREVKPVLESALWVCCKPGRGTEFPVSFRNLSKT